MWNIIARRMKPDDPFFYILGTVLLAAVGVMVFFQLSGFFDYLYLKKEKENWKHQGINYKVFVEKMKEKHPNSPFNWDEAAR